MRDIGQDAAKTLWALRMCERSMPLPPPTPVRFSQEEKSYEVATDGPMRLVKAVMASSKILASSGFCARYWKESMPESMWREAMPNFATAAIAWWRMSKVYNKKLSHSRGSVQRGQNVTNDGFGSRKSFRIN